MCVSGRPAPLSVCRGSHGPGKGLSTEAIKQCVCWNNVFDLAAGQQQVLGGPSWSCCSPPALICRPGTSLSLSVSFPSIQSLTSPLLAFVPLFLPLLSQVSLLLLSLLPFALSTSLFLRGSSALSAVLLTFSFLIFFFFYSIFLLMSPLTFYSPHIIAVKKLSCTAATHLLDLNDTTEQWMQVSIYASSGLLKETSQSLGKWMVGISVKLSFFTFKRNCPLKLKYAYWLSCWS